MHLLLWFYFLRPLRMNLHLKCEFTFSSLMLVNLLYISIIL